MAYKASNQAAAELAVGLNTIDTTLQVATGKGDRFPAISGVNHTYVTLENSGGDIEVVKVTARTAGSDSMTIVRAQDGTTAKTWLGGDIVECRPCAAAIADVQAEAIAGDAGHVAASDPHPQYTTAAELSAGLTAYAQPANANLDAEANLTGAADKLAYYTGAGAKALTTMTAAARSLLDDADAETMRTTLGAQAALVSGANIKTVNGGSLLGSGDILVGETTGAVAAFAMNSVPSGWLAANGAAVSRTTYAALFAAIGTTYGAGDGSTTFALPDLRGYFARGSGTNSDGTASGTFGAKQADELKAHAHNLSIALKPPSDFSTTYPSHSSNNGDGASVTATSTGGTETRPKNIAMLYCIKY